MGGRDCHLGHQVGQSKTRGKREAIDSSRQEEGKNIPGIKKVDMRIHICTRRRPFSQVRDVKGRQGKNSGEKKGYDVLLPFLLDVKKKIGSRGRLSVPAYTP